MFNLFSNKFNDIKNTVRATAQALVGNIVSSDDSADSEISEIFIDNMEDNLISADIGVALATELSDKLRKMPVKPKNLELKKFLKQEFTNVLDNFGSSELNFTSDGLNIYFITGVNGAGKTTLIGKLAYFFKQNGKKVLIAAADTFRAAAEDQLEIWSERAGVDIVRKDKADPASVVYDAISKSKSENYDVLLIDTAGRLQNKFNLMEELKKIKSVIDKNAPEALKESILVLDANTGQNGLQQAKVFNEGVKITSIGLTKLDGSAKGGIVLAIAKEFNIPIKLVGVGEKIEDLKQFNYSDFIDALFSE